MNLEKLEYYRGMYRSTRKVRRRQADERYHFQAPDIPEPILASFEEERIHRLSGDYGLPDAGDPTQVDVLVFTADGQARKVRVINRAITLFTSPTEEVKRLHRFFGTIEKAAEQRGRLK